MNESLETYNRDEDPLPSIHSQLSFHEYEETDFNLTDIQEFGRVSDIKRGMMKRSVVINSLSEDKCVPEAYNNLSSYNDTNKQSTIKPSCMKESY